MRIWHTKKYYGAIYFTLVKMLYIASDSCSSQKAYSIS